MKIEKIRRALEEGAVGKAVEIAKTVDSARVKSAADLSVVAEAYYRHGDLDTALVYYEQIYQKNKSRRILISIINLCLKLSMVDMAEDYLKDFVEIAPKDFYRHIFRYRLDKLEGKGIEILIADLEALKEENYMEDWAYELAKLYHKAGQAGQCVSECDDIILWFGTGIYVERARALRAVNLAANGTGTMGEKDEEFVMEVQRLLTADKTESAAGREKNYISPIREGEAVVYSEEEYRKERYGEPPVYEEEGKDVIWNTQEFGPVTQEMLAQQNTMDILQGMQVAQQLKMQLDANRELSVKEPEEKKLQVAAIQPQNKTRELPKGWSWETQESKDKNVKAQEPAKKSLWERRQEKKRREQEERKKKKAEETVQKEPEVDENLYRMLQEEEREAELSKAVKSVTSTEKIEPSEENFFEEETQKNFGKKEQTEEELGKTKPFMIQGGADTSAKNNEMEQKESVMEQETPLVLYQYPDDLLLGLDNGEAPEFCQKLKEHGMRAEDFFPGILASIQVRRILLHYMEQVFRLKNKSLLLLITGEPQCGKTTIAKEVAKCAHSLGGVDFPRVAVISGSGLNRLKLSEKKKQLLKTTLIVEKASELSAERAAELAAILPEFSGKTGVILEDEKEKLDQLLQQNKELEKAVTSRIDLPTWTTEDLFLQALSLLAAKDYQMEESVAEQFLERVRVLLEENPKNSFQAVHSYVGQVIERADKRVADMLRTFTLEGHYKEEDLLLLRELDL